MFSRKWLALVFFFISTSLSITAIAQPNLTVNNGQTVNLGGVHRYDVVRVRSGGRIVVPDFNGSDKANTGNLQIVANSIIVEQNGSIIADGAGYQPRLCDHGRGPNSTAGGRGGCAVLDSGGGGAHFGPGGRGTKDCFCVGDDKTCQFPQEFEENCGYRHPTENRCVSTGGAPTGTCPSPSGCYNNNGLPSVAGIPYWHSIYEVEFGSAGGDKGCRDGWASCTVGGAGGGRIVLAAVNATKGGTLNIQGTVSAVGYRGCGQGNDSGGGGAGGSLLLVGDSVTIGDNASVTAAGGLGGDTNAKQAGSHCPSCAQAPGGTCDDCGGGGGGGIISVLAGQPATISSEAMFNVAGADGGTCPICKGEAGGGAGELQLSGVYGGEFCDGYDNDFDGKVDEDLGNVSCGSGACQKSVTQCNISDPDDVFPNDCVPASTPSCQPALTDTRTRFLLITDTSGSMLTDLSGNYTFGDGSSGHEGLDTNNDGRTNDSRLYKAKQALTQVISAYPEIDFSLARFAQGVGPSVNCQLAHWFECAGLCCTYDNPTDNTGGTPPGGACTVSAGSAGNIAVRPTSNGDECINYAGSCGKPRRGADILVGFERPIEQKLMWMDHAETSFNKSTTPGNHCGYGVGGDCELRGTGPTPLAGSLYSAKAFLARELANDKIGFCRKYAVILLTDGSETCNGNPATAAAELLSIGVETYVVGFSVLPSEQAQLNSIAKAGSDSGTRNAFFAGNEAQLASVIASIVADTIVFEQCNGEDDDCDNKVDEDFPLKDKTCDNGKQGICYKTGKYVCKADGSGVRCDAPNANGVAETCNGLDDDCNGAIDDVDRTCSNDEDCSTLGNATCQSNKCVCDLCVPQPEICNGIDDDCDNEVDEDFVSQPCGKELGECKPGNTKCEDGKLLCDGGTAPENELCNGKDDDCDGTRDGISEPCYSFDSGCVADIEQGWLCKGFCKPGLKNCTAQEDDGVWTGVWGDCLGQIGPKETEECNGIDDDCDGETDEAAECPGGSQCIEGQCSSPCSVGEFVCPIGQLCQEGWCIKDPCDFEACDAKGWVCKSGECIDPCLKRVCDKYEICQRGACIDTSCYNPDNACEEGKTCLQGECVTDPCAETTCKAGQFCRDGKCLALCDSFSCGADESCKTVEDGDGFVTRCVKDMCSSKNCGEGYACKDGSCIVDPCLRVGCEKGEFCRDGECLTDPCETISCPENYVCSEGTCVSTRLREVSNVLATGAGGCSCRVGSASESASALIWLLLLAGWFVLRKRGRKEQSRRGKGGVA